MEQIFSTKISKLLVESGNKGIIGDVFIAKPEKNLANKLGIIFGIIELFGLPEELVDKISEIISDFETEYYLPPFETEYGLEKRFEECLERNNRRLSKVIKDSASHSGLKNINVLLGLIYRNKIYLSQIGNVNAFLFHIKKKHDFTIIDIISQASEKQQKINPEKMFSNIISGAITAKDSLLFCNDAVLEYLSQNELMEIVVSNTPLAAASELEKILSGQNQQDNFYAIIVQPEETEENKPTRFKNRAAIIEPSIPSQTSINQLINTQRKTEECLTPSFIPNWKKALLIAIFGLKKISKFSYKYFKIFIQNIFWLIKLVVRKIKEKTPIFLQAIKEALKSIAAKPKNFDTFITEIKIFAKKIKSAPLSSPIKINAADSPSLPKKMVGDIIDYSQILAKHKNQGGAAQKISLWLNRQIAKFLALRRWQQILAVAAFILIFFFSQSIVWQGQNSSQSQKGEVDQLIKQIKENLNTAEAQNIYNDEAGARNSLAKAEEFLAQIPDKRKYEETKKEIQEKIENLYLLLQKVSYLENPKIIADFSRQNPQAQTIGLAKAGKTLFSFDNQNQNFYKIDLENEQITASQLNSSLNKVQKITALDEKNIIFLNQEKEFYKYNWENNSAENILIANSIIEDFDTYGGKLYTLQTEKNQIYKHFPVTSGYNAGSPWLKDNTDVKNAIALAIDGGVYLLSGDGKINYFASGKAQETDFAEIKPALASPQQIATKFESNYLYILDPPNQRIIVFDKKGNLKIQYNSKEFQNMKTMAVDEASKKIYLLAGNKVFMIEIGF